MTQVHESTVSWRIVEGDCRTSLAAMPEASVQTCVTSPPYFGLRDYGHAEQIGLEPTPERFVDALVETFRAVRRVLKGDGTVWLNLGDSYASGEVGRVDGGHPSTNPDHWTFAMEQRPRAERRIKQVTGLPPKSLLGIPWRAALGLQADGWILRSDIIWSKPNPMPESVTDRPTKAHEYLFLLSKAPRYFYDADAIREPSDYPHLAGQLQRVNYADESKLGRAEVDPHAVERAADRNRRSVWTVATQPFAGAHFATFPPKLIEPCILAGSRPGDVVLDPFSGSGTTGMVALRHDRSYVGCELNPEYVELSRRRITDDAPLLNQNAEMAA